MRSRRGFKNPNDFKPYWLRLENPFSFEVFELDGYSMSKSSISVINIIDNGKIRLTVDHLIPDYHHPNRFVIDTYMVILVLHMMPDDIYCNVPF